MLYYPLSALKLDTRLIAPPTVVRVRSEIQSRSSQTDLAATI